MNSLVEFNSTLKMTSLEIAEMTEKLHVNVKRTIRDLASKGIIQLPQIDKVKNNQSLSPNSKTEVYVFDFEHKRDSFVVVARLSPEFTARVVDRWQELEAQQQQPKTQAEMLVIYAQQLVDLERRQTKTEALALENKSRLEQIETGIDHFTVIGYARAYLNQSFDLKRASRYGKIATKLCNDMGILMGTVPDPRFGQVNTYPKSVLDEVFSTSEFSKVSH